jgi:hypothetical protein
MIGPLFEGRVSCSRCSQGKGSKRRTIRLKWWRASCRRGWRWASACAPGIIGHMHACQGAVHGLCFAVCLWFEFHLDVQTCGCTSCDFIFRSRTCSIQNLFHPEPGTGSDMGVSWSCSTEARYGAHTYTCNNLFMMNKFLYFQFELLCAWYYIYVYIYIYIYINMKQTHIVCNTQRAHSSNYKTKNYNLLHN